MVYFSHSYPKDLWGGMILNSFFFFFFFIEMISQAL